jgi:hypothetical protein
MREAPRGEFVRSFHIHCPLRVELGPSFIPNADIPAMSAIRERISLSSADTVEKLLFRSYSKNSRPVEASLLLGRGGPGVLPLRAAAPSNKRSDDSQNELSIPTHPHENSESLQFGVFQHGVIPGTGRHDRATRVCRCYVPVNREGERNERLCWIGHIAEVHFDLRG